METTVFIVVRVGPRIVRSTERLTWDFLFVYYLFCVKYHVSDYFFVWCVLVLHMAFDAKLRHRKQIARQQYSAEIIHRIYHQP